MAEAQALHLNSEQRARVLDEALEWIRGFRGDIVVIKYGGHTMTDPGTQKAFTSDVQFLQHIGMFPVVVHGGGPQVSTMLDELDIETPFREGVRITTPEAMEIAHTVLTDQVQRRLVLCLNQRNSLAVGISGKDGVLFGARRRTGVNEEGEEIDFGLVNEITSADPDAVLELLDAGCIPVISSIAIDQDNARQILSINAGTATSALAVALNASKLLMLTDTEGVYSNCPDPDSLLHHMTPSQLRTLGDTISSGMIPKVQACLQAVEDGVDAVRVVGGCQMHSVLIRVMTDEGIGTMVVPDSMEKDA